MDILSRKELEESYRTVTLIRDTPKYRIELVEQVSDKTNYIKRTYFEDKREIFFPLMNADIPYTAPIKAILFDTDTIILEKYMEGQTLKEYLLHTPVSAREASRLVTELLCAVRGIHKLGIIHRDIKPDNILVDRSGHICLIDFGIARVYRPNKSNDTQLLGTVGYAAPEQFGFAQSDFRTDIFSIGVTCRDIIRVCQKNRLLRKIERKCTKMDPFQRYPDVEAILAEFRRKKLRTVCASAVLLILFLLTGTGFYFFSRPGQLPAQESNPEETPDAGPRDSFAASPENQSDRIFENNLNSKKKVNFKARQQYRIFTGQESAPCLLLEEGEQTSESATLKGQPDSVQIQAQLSPDGLSLCLTDALHNSLNLLLSNTYPVIEDYPDISLYAGLLFYDIDSDGQDQIRVAVSDRCYLTLRDGSVACNQNYTAGWCIYYDESGNFQLAEGQLFASPGELEIDKTISGGVWIESTYEGYVLKDGVLTYLP